HAGFANQPASAHRDDGLRLLDAWVSATLRCAPPLNKPLPDEIERCEPYLLEELRRLDRVRVVVGLGRIGWQAYLRARRRLGLPRRRAAAARRAAGAGGAAAMVRAGLRPGRGGDAGGRRESGGAGARARMNRRLLEARDRVAAARGALEGAGARARMSTRL